MAVVKFSGNSDESIRTPFKRSQKTVANFNDLTDTSPAVELTSKKYTFIRTLLPSFATETTILKGRLGVDTPFEDRRITSFKNILKDSRGRLVSRIEIDEITGLRLGQFIDRGFDSLKRVLRGNDEIIGTEGAALLFGFRGDDQISMASFNRAFGGAGADSFVFSKDTRSAQVLDFKFGKDKLFISDDDVNNYSIVTSFGTTEVVNIINGAIIATLENLTDPEDVAGLSLEAFSTERETIGFKDFLGLQPSSVANTTLKGKDKITGSSFSDFLDGFKGKDNIRGGGGDDQILGGNGMDRLFGEDGDDILKGGKGDDFLDGGKGVNTLLGGQGSDIFKFSKKGVSIIKDFNPLNDFIDLPGPLSEFSQYDFIQTNDNTILLGFFADDIANDFKLKLKSKTSFTIDDVNFV